MTREELQAKLSKVEAIARGAATEGERGAARTAAATLRARLATLPPPTPAELREAERRRRAAEPPRPVVYAPPPPSLWMLELQLQLARQRAERELAALASAPVEASGPSTVDEGSGSLWVGWRGNGWGR